MSAQSHGDRKVFVTGDLNVDFVLTGASIGEISRIPAPRPRVGGSAFNAAVAFRREEFHSILFGKVGADANGDLIVDGVRQLHIDHFIERDPAKPTGTCHIMYFKDADHLRTVFYFEKNANDYVAATLRNALVKANISERDFVFSPFHLYEQTDRHLDRCRTFFNDLRSRGARLILDVVPHTLHQAITMTDFRHVVAGPVDVLIGEYRTLAGLIDIGVTRDDVPSPRECAMFSDHFNADVVICRFGIGNIGRQIVFTRRVTTRPLPREAADTGYERLPDAEKRGYGDYLTARTLAYLLGTGCVS